MRSPFAALAVLAAITAQAAVAPAANAQTVAALLDGDRIAMIDAGSRKVTGVATIAGAPAALVGIDVRPSDGMLYGLAADGTVVTLDARTGKATPRVKLETMVASGTWATMDFNPVADRLRVIGADGTNLRANVDDGKVVRDGALKFADTDMHKGETPMVSAGAYTNSVKGAKETALFDIDTKIGVLLKQAPPNDGVLVSIGKLGIEAKSVAFDIAADASGTNTGWLVSGATLYRVDIATGKATEAGRVDGLTGTVRKIAVLPAG